jgi:hypothetical protein
MHSLRTIGVAALVLTALVIAYALLFPATRTEPSDSPIVQAFLEIGKDASSPQPVSGPRINALKELPLPAAKDLLTAAGFGCSEQPERSPVVRCMRDFASVAGPCFWKVALWHDEHGRVTSIAATREGWCPSR